jgi:translation initiation factor 1 (eIF-1/SUI1)
MEKDRRDELKREFEQLAEQLAKIQAEGNRVTTRLIEIQGILKEFPEE